MDKDTTYNGYANYETWNVMLWINNDQGDQEYWLEAARSVIAGTRDKHPNEFADKAGNERMVLAGILKDRYEDNTPTVVGCYADLLNHSLCQVDWYEIAEQLLDDAKEL